MYEKATELLERLPEDYIEDDYKAKLQKLGGLAVPLNIFLFQVMTTITIAVGTAKHMMGSTVTKPMSVH